jgi:DNA-binding transcriptional LysR family regulator
MNVELRQIRHAAAVAELGSFVRAAADLNLSQSALSRSVQALERQVGTPLFVRSANGVMTTDVGRLFLERGRALLAMADALDLQVLHNRSLQRGRIVVGAGPAAMEYLLPKAAAAFFSEHPMMTVELRSASLVDMPAPLRSREIDLLVVNLDPFEDEPDVDIEPLSEHPLVVVGRAGHPLAGRSDVTLEETFDHPWVAVGRTPQRFLDVLLGAQQRAPAASARLRAFPALQCQSVSAARDAVLESDALTLLTPAAVRVMVESGEMAPVMSLAGRLSSRNAFVRLKSRPPSAACALLCSMLRSIDLHLAEENARLLTSWFGAGTDAVPVPPPRHDGRDPSAVAAGAGPG